MTTELLCMAVGPLVLPTAKPFSITSAVLQQNDFSICSANSRHLFKRNHRIWKSARRKRRDNRVKGPIRKRKSLRVRQQERNGHREFCGALPCYIQHFSADIHSDNPATGRIKSKVLSCSNRNFEDFSRRLSQELPPKFSNSKEIRDSLDKIEPARKAVVLF